MKTQIVIIGLLSLLSNMVLAQTTAALRSDRMLANDTVHIQRNQDGILRATADLQASAACPMNVSAGQAAAQFSGEVSTTNPNGVSYQVTIRYDSETAGGSLEHAGLETNRGEWSLPPTTGGTVLYLTATVTPAQPLQWAATLLAKTPGTVFYEFKTYNNGVLSRDENCTFDIVQATGSFAGTVFLDTDSDGQQQGGEPGLPGWMVYVDGNANQQYDAGADTVMVTGSDGQFMFGNQPLPVDLGVVVPEGWDQTFPVGGFQTISEDGEEGNFGARPKSGGIFGAKWEDSDSNGLLNPGEPLLSGWTIYLDLNGDNILNDGEPSTVTDKNGRYQFLGLAPGAYVVREVPQQPFVQTFPKGPDEHTVVLGQNEIAAGRSFGNFRLASVHGKIFEDKNANGVQDAGEFGKDGITITIRSSFDGPILATATTMSVDLNGDGTIDPSTEQGLYSFEGLTEELYFLDLTMLPEGFREVRKEPLRSILTISSGERIENFNRAVTSQALLYGVKLGDRKGMGNPDDFSYYEGEKITIQLLDAVTGEVLASTNVGGFGERDERTFSFDVQPGKTYIIQEVAPEGAAQTFPPDKTYSVTPAAGEELTELNFANRNFIGRISGFKVVSENGLPFRRTGGWTINLVGLDNPVKKTTVTGDVDVDGDGTLERGAYLFDGLPAGTYLIAEVPQDGFRIDRPRLGFFTIEHQGDGIRPFDFFNIKIAVTPINDSGDGEGLRQAIDENNALPLDSPPLHIKVNSEESDSSGVRFGRAKTIRPTTIIRPSRPLPVITRPVIIDGGGTIILDGSDAGDGANGLVISGGGTDIRGLTVTNFRGHGILLENEGLNRILNCQVSNNGGDGIRISSGTENTFLGNAIFNNSGMAIDVGADGPTPNDEGDINGVQNSPVIRSVVTDTAVVIDGTLGSTPDTTLLLEFFASGTCKASGDGEGEVFLGSIPVFTDSLGQASFTASFDTTLAGQRYITATATNTGGNTSEFSSCFEIVTSVSEEEEILPSKFVLHQNYPNPFNPTTTIRFDLSRRSTVKLKIYDLTGREVATLVDQELPAGQHRVEFHAGGLASGIYFSRLEGRGFLQVRKLTLLK